MNNLYVFTKLSDNNTEKSNFLTINIDSLEFANNIELDSQIAVKFADSDEKLLTIKDLCFLLSDFSVVDEEIDGIYEELTKNCVNDEDKFDIYDKILDFYHGIDDLSDNCKDIKKMTDKICSEHAIDRERRYFIDNYEYTNSYMSRFESISDEMQLFSDNLDKIGDFVDTFADMMVKGLKKDNLWQNFLSITQQQYKSSDNSGFDE